MLESVKTYITDLKRYEAKSIEDYGAESGMHGKPTREWLEMCQKIRFRELETYSLFFRSFMTYIERFEQNRGVEGGGDGGRDEEKK